MAFQFVSSLAILWLMYNSLLYPLLALAADFTDPVVSILDGDTIEFLHNQHPERIRFGGTDCPEKGQVYGKRAKQAMSELLFGKEVTLQTISKDKYGRTIADVLLPDGTNVNHTLVKEGRLSTL
jgi:endonuclease YncB( thermonuclease family)